MKTACTIIVLTIAASSQPVLAQDGQVQSSTTPDGRYITVETGPQEAASTGSYAVRLYGNDNPGFPTDDFIAGVVRPRDGQLLPIGWHDVTGDDIAELVIVSESAGSGGYHTADAFELGEDGLTLAATVSGVTPDQDVPGALKNALE